MADLERLAKEHAYWADRKNRLRGLGCIAASRCFRVRREMRKAMERGWFSHIPDETNCIEYARDAWIEANNECYESGFTFEEIYDEEYSEGRVCSNCHRVRKLKKARTYAGTRLGAIRSAITKAGRRLIEEGEA